MRLKALGVAALLLMIAGCGGGSKETTTRINAKQYLVILERAKSHTLDMCHESGDYATTDTFVDAANIVLHHPDDDLPDGETVREWADGFIAEAHRKCGTEAGTIELIFIPPDDEFPIEREGAEKREYEALIFGEFGEAATVFRRICSIIEKKGLVAATEDFVGSVPYYEIEKAEAAFPKISEACAE